MTVHLQLQYQLQNRVDSHSALIRRLALSRYFSTVGLQLSVPSSTTLVAQDARATDPLVDRCDQMSCASSKKPGSQKPLSIHRDRLTV